MRRKLTNLGARGLLEALGGLVAFASISCGGTPVYGAVPDTAYGMPACYDDSDCQDAGADWYCDKSGWARCRPRPSDAGSPTLDDAGTAPDTGD